MSYLVAGMPPLYHAVTNGIRVTVRPQYAPEHSDAGVPRHVFVYHIRIENVGERTPPHYLMPLACSTGRVVPWGTVCPGAIGTR